LTDKTGILVIIDGLGLRRDGMDNPVALANTPFIDSFEHIPLTAVGPSVGMPEDAKGSTAVGHEVMSGADYVHPMLRISRDIIDGELRNPVIDKVLEDTAQRRAALHLMGLVSTNREHSDIRHLYAVIRRAVVKNITKIRIHFFSDGRGTPPFSAVRFAEDLLEKTEEIKNENTDIKIATVGGRDITMNRSSDSWYKTEKTFRAIVEGHAERAKDIFKALKEDYNLGITDQYIKVRVLGDYSGAVNGDTLIHWNFRKDRSAMLMQMLAESEEKLKQLTGDKNFRKVKYKKELDFNSLQIAGLVQYYEGMTCPAAYCDIKQEHSLGSLLEEYGYKQFRVSGVDKRLAVILLSGGTRKEPFEHEKRIVVPLPGDMENYKREYEDKKGEEGFTLDPYEKYPEIELPELTKKITELIERASGKTFIIVNISNPDMVGHTANIEAGVKAAEAVDRSLQSIAEAAREKGAYLFITADHGNLEVMETEDGQPSTFHTQNPVPFGIIAPREYKMAAGGCLKDVAPTVLYVMEPRQIEDISEKLKGDILIEGEKGAAIE